MLMVMEIASLKPFHINYLVLQIAILLFDKLVFKILDHSITDVHVQGAR